MVHAEAMSFLTPGQYWHLSAQVRELALSEQPTNSETIDVQPIRDFYEIRDKGGILQKINARVFFFVHHQTRTIVVLGAINKKNDGQTPAGTVRTMRRRMRLYLAEAKPPPTHSHSQLS
jgi:phage-related protein